MEDRKRTILAVVIISVVLLAVLYSFSINLFAVPPTLELPDPNASSSVKPSGEATDANGGIVVEVSTQTVQSLIAFLTRYESYSRTVSVEYYSGGQLVGVVSAQVWADGGWTRADVTLSSGRVEHSIVGDGRLWLWYDQESSVYTGPAEEASADLAQRLPTYEDVLELDRRDITAASYVERGGLPCVYVEVRQRELRYLERFWISVESGLLVASETEKDGETVYRMSSYEVESPLSEVEDSFTLPDGTVLHQTAA